MILEKLLHYADTRSAKLAVADPTRRLNYGQLTTFARVMRDVVLAESAAPRVGILLPGTAAFAGTFLGCLWARRIAVPLNFLLQKEELQRIAADAGLDAVITIEYFRELAGALGVKTVLLERAGLKRKFLLAKLRRTPVAPPVEAQQTAVVLYTSGTSGEPKGVELTHGNLTSNCRDCIAHARIDCDHRLLSVLPPFHIFGLTCTTLMPLWEGMTVHYLPRFNPGATVRAIAAEGISVFMAIPSMYAAMQRVKKASAESFKSLSLAFSGGEPLPENIARAYEERFNVTLNEGYGLTETSPVISLNLPWDHRRGAVGRPLPNCEIRIVGTGGRPVPAGQHGEITVRGPGVMKGYYNKPLQTDEVIDAEGWLKTGDRGKLDGDGFISITGRIKEMMIIGGENVFPSEIENVLCRHPAVDEAAVIGVPDESRGEVAVAYVILKEDHDADENQLRSLCREHLASAKVPRQVVISEDLPRGPTGKILKRALNAGLTTED